MFVSFACICHLHNLAIWKYVAAKVDVTFYTVLARPLLSLNSYYHVGKKGQCTRRPVADSITNREYVITLNR